MRRESWRLQFLTSRRTVGTHVLKASIYSICTLSPLLEPRKSDPVCSLSKPLINTLNLISQPCHKLNGDFSALPGAERGRPRGMALPPRGRHRLDAGPPQPRARVAHRQGLGRDPKPLQARAV